MTAGPVVETPVAETPSVEGLEPTNMVRVEDVAPPAHRADRALPSIASANPIAAFLQTALQTGKSPDELGKLVDLFERMEDRDAERQFAAALAAFQAKCPQIIKKRTKEGDATERGSNFSYTWANEDDVVQQIRKDLVEFGLSFSFDTVEKDATGPNTSAKLLTTFWLQHSAGHKRGTTIGIPLESRAGMSPQQKYGSALAFGRRYSLLAGLGITASDDPAGVEDNDPTLLDFNQLEELEGLIAESGVDIQKFLKYLEVPALKDVRRVKFAAAKSALEQRIATKVRKASREAAK